MNIEKKKKKKIPYELWVTRRGHGDLSGPGGTLSTFAYGGVSPRNFQATQKYHFSITGTQKYQLILHLETYT